MNTCKVTVEDLSEAISVLKSRREIMRGYLSLKIEESDWHGVADAAMDLRDIESELKAFRAVEKGEYE